MSFKKGAFWEGEGRIEAKKRGGEGTQLDSDSKKRRRRRNFGKERKEKTFLVKEDERIVGKRKGHKYITDYESVNVSYVFKQLENVKLIRQLAPPLPFLFVPDEKIRLRNEFSETFVSFGFFEVLKQKYF
jgi:hypothetical protein